VVALSIVFLVLLFLTVDFFYHHAVIRRAAARTPIVATRAVHLPAIRAHAVPHAYFIDSGHTWLALEQSGEVMMGADAIATTLLGEIDEVELKPAGARIAPGDVVATIRRGGRSIELASPVEGVIESVNLDPTHDPDVLRRDPYADGWLYRLKTEGIAGQLGDLHVGEEAALFLSRELDRVRAAIEREAGAAAADAGRAEGGGLAEGAAVSMGDTAFERIVKEIFGQPRPSPWCAQEGSR
jgi:glycine cleavage system H protein